MPAPEDAKAKVRSWGFPCALTCVDGANARLLMIRYPEDPSPKSRAKRLHYGVGQRVDVPANRVYEMWAGSEGCTRVMGG
ncbi:predicted protein [Chaetomium globosum CBS 148.51]|uniref:Uncharacterized protein n=1 Tax=Chaetomium globosum (strain ATCC 6205 / CBS 148.51 / DSM 1962 / NBRC 6347 / NRRL 1970) TaxID=306901 RepID=Q2H4F9_CHAGB|nr:uncharacterized protein CHGG_06456 [Chaetomium globosum CBS 148.51]EAQ89837.1 predicted protein [Chaetomium globosum CBS 148.51]